MKRNCLTCDKYLGGNYSYCRDNLELECADGDFEAWKSKNDQENNNED